MFIIKKDGKYAVVTENSRRVILLFGGVKTEWFDNIEDILYSVWWKNFREDMISDYDVVIRNGDRSFKSLKWSIKDYLNDPE